MFENSLQLISAIVAALASVGIGFLLGIGLNRPTQSDSESVFLVLLDGPQRPILIAIMTVIALTGLTGIFIGSDGSLVMGDADDANVNFASYRGGGAPSSDGSGDPVVQLHNNIKEPGRTPTILSTRRTILAGKVRPFMARAPSLLDVDSMISRMVDRLKNSPNDADGWRLLGWSYFHSKNYEKSVAAYDRALKLNPGSVKLQAVLSHVRNVVEEPLAGNASK